METMQLHVISEENSSCGNPVLDLQIQAGLHSLLENADVMAQILSFLPSSERLSSVPSICRQFQEAAKRCPPAAVTLRLRRYCRPEYRMQLFRSWVDSIDSGLIKSLQLSCDGDITCPACIECIDPTEGQDDSPESIPSAPYAALSGLQSLELNGFPLTATEAGHLQGLTSLQTASPCSCCSATAIALLSNLQQLNLTLIGDTRGKQMSKGPERQLSDTATAWRALGSSLTSLSSLQLQFATFTGRTLGDELIPLLSGLSSLRNLAIQDDALTADALGLIASHLGQLTSFALTFKSTWMVNTLDLTGLSGLQKISLSCMTIEDPLPLAALTQLTSLHAYAWEFTTAAAGLFLEGVIPKLTWLQHLSMVYIRWPAASAALFGKIAQLGQLRSLTLAYQDSSLSTAAWPMSHGGTGPGLFAVPGSMLALEELIISSKVFKSSSELGRLAAACPNLIKLHIDGLIRPMSVANGITALTSLRQLQEVRLEILNKPSWQQRTENTGEASGPLVFSAQQQALTEGFWQRRRQRQELTPAAVAALRDLLNRNA